jgi:hypothetical protein
MTNQEQYELICEKAKKYDGLVAVLDKIRAEIVDELDHLKNYRDKDMAVYCRMTACKKHIAIIDKYRKESE